MKEYRLIATGADILIFVGGMTFLIGVSTFLISYYEKILRIILA